VKRSLFIVSLLLLLSGNFFIKNNDNDTKTDESNKNSDSFIIEQLDFLRKLPVSDWPEDLIKNIKIGLIEDGELMEEAALVCCLQKIVWWPNHVLIKFYDKNYLYKIKELKKYEQKLLQAEQSLYRLDDQSAYVADWSKKEQDRFYERCSVAYHAYKDSLSRREYFLEQLHLPESI
jgi:hypothetical protein